MAYHNLGNVSPNPSVGAVIVKDGEIIGKGTTQSPGGNHAEIEAINSCDPEGATLYVTLEPCSHSNKRTPPCVNAIVEAGIKKVVIGVRDENPEVSGIKFLKENGVKVSTMLKEEAKQAHEFYLKWVKDKIPFVTVKFVVTLNGMMTWGDGRRMKITGEEADQRVHEARRIHDAILIGVNTVIKDDPQLTCRLVEGKNPIRVILDSKLRIPENSIEASVWPFLVRTPPSSAIIGNMWPGFRKSSLLAERAFFIVRARS